MPPVRWASTIRATRFSVRCSMTRRNMTATSGSRRAATNASSSRACPLSNSSVTRWVPTVEMMSVGLPLKSCSAKSWSNSPSDWASIAASSSSALPRNRP